MSTAADHRGHGFASSVAFSAARGAALIAIAVVLGVVLLQVVDTGNGGPVGDGGAKATGATPGATTPTSTPPGTEPTPTTQVRPPGEVHVLVLNGSGVAGAAGRLTGALQTDGYLTGNTPLAPADTARRTGTVVYYRAGFVTEAAGVAGKVGPGTPTEALPEPPPAGTVPQAEVVVVLGA